MYHSYSLCVLFLSRPEKFNGLLQRLQFLKAHQLASSDLKPGIQLLARFFANIQRVLEFEYRLNKRNLNGMLINVGSHKPVSHWDSKSGRSACWIPLDIYMENAMDGKQLPIKSATDVLAGKLHEEEYDKFIFVHFYMNM